MRYQTKGDDRLVLPIPATYVIDRDGTVPWLFVDVDYRNRLEPAGCIEGCRAAWIDDLSDRSIGFGDCDRRASVARSASSWLPHAGVRIGGWLDRSWTAEQQPNQPPHPAFKRSNH